MRFSESLAQMEFAFKNKGKVCHSTTSGANADMTFFYPNDNFVPSGLC